jgi:hypothetical protein
MRSAIALNVWASRSGMTTARRYLAGAGTASDALSFGGYNGSYLATTERYNGTSTAAPTKRIRSFNF